MREVPPHVAKKLLLFSQGERAKILDELSRLPLNQNNLADILDLLAEISRRDRVSASTIVLGGIVATKEIIDPYKKIDGLKEFLRQKRFPLYHEKKRRFEEAVKKLRLPETASVTPSPFFEETLVEMKATLRSEEDLKKLVEAMKAETWTEIFEVIS